MDTHTHTHTGINTGLSTKKHTHAHTKIKLVEVEERRDGEREEDTANAINKGYSMQDTDRQIQHVVVSRTHVESMSRETSR